jgi:hypothetical protein
MLFSGHWASTEKLCCKKGQDKIIKARILGTGALYVENRETKYTEKNFSLS